LNTFEDRNEDLRARERASAPSAKDEAGLRVLIYAPITCESTRLTAFLRRHPSVRLAISCPSLLKAIHLVQSRRPGILFFDLDAPGYFGHAFIQHLKNGPRLVALLSPDKIRTGILDAHEVAYLLKPFDEREVSLMLEASVTSKSPNRGGAPVHPPRRARATQPSTMKPVDPRPQETCGGCVKLR